ncbi:MAG: DUF2953 domain-containing protein [Caulobacteraceae bacterium]
MLYLILSVLILLVLIYYMPIVTEIKIQKRNRDDSVSIYIKTGYELINIKLEVPELSIHFRNGRPFIEYKAEMVSRRADRLLFRLNKIFTQGEMKKTYEQYERNKGKFVPVQRYLLKKIKVEDMYVKLAIGTGDAAGTGIAYGVAWIAVGNIIALSNIVLDIKQHQVFIVPIFDSIRFNLDFNCIINLKFGHIINAGIRAVFVLVSGKRR